MLTGVILMAAPLERRDVNCGGHSCYVALASLGYAVGSFDDFQRRLGKPGNLGYSLLQLRDAACSYGAYAACIRCDLKGLDRLERPFVCVPLLRGGHFVALVDFDAARTWVVDAPDYLEIPRSLLEARWPGECLVLSTKPLPDFEEMRPPRGRMGFSIALSAVLAIVLAAGVWRWRRTLSTNLMGATLALSLIAGCAKPTKPLKGPIAVVDATFIDLGRFMTSAPKRPEGTFTLRNAGDADLLISKVQLSCTCADARLSEKALKPGDCARLDIRLKPVANMKLPSAQIRVSTNDPKNSILELTIQWEVIHEFSATPGELSFQAAAAEHSAQRVAIQYNGSKPIEELAQPQLHFDQTMFEARFEKAANGASHGGKRWGDVVVRPRRPPAPHADSAAQILLTIPPENDRLAIMVRWTRQIDFEAAPNEVYAGIVAPRQRGATKVIFRSHREPVKALRLISGELVPKATPQQFDPPAPTSAHVVELVFEAPASKGVFCKTLKFELNGNASRTALVSIRGLVR